MMGRLADRVAISWNPALRKVDAKPVQAKASGMVPDGKSCGYSSTMVAPEDPVASAPGVGSVGKIAVAEERPAILGAL